jgi:HTH-type transcriptional regulator/antitoxin HipB
MFDVLRMGKMVRFHRKMARLSQLELAKLAGVGKTVVFDLEHGKETVKLMTLLKLLHTLNIRLQFSGPLVESFEKENNEKS